MRAAAGQRVYNHNHRIARAASALEVFAKRSLRRPANRLPGDATTYLPLVLSPGISVFTIKPLGEVFLETNYGITVSDQSLRNWQKLLINRNWITKDKENVKYYLCRGRAAPRNAGEGIQNSVAEFYARLGAGESGTSYGKKSITNTAECRENNVD